MHDGLQVGTIALVLFGIMLNRYDYNALRKEMREELSGMRKEISDVRMSLERQTTALVNLIFTHEGRITRLEEQAKRGQ